MFVRVFFLTLLSLINAYFIVIPVECIVIIQIVAITIWILDLLFFLRPSRRACPHHDDDYEDDDVHHKKWRRQQKHRQLPFLG